MSDNILTLTMNPSIDKNAKVRKIEPDKKLRCQEPLLAAGGGGINVARAIKKLGGAARAIYPAGGSTGDIIEQLLKKDDANQLRINTENWTRENFTVIEEETNKQYRFNMPGPHLNEREWKKCLKTVLIEAQNADFLVASGSLPIGVPDDFYAELAKNASNSKLKLVIDCSGKALKNLKERGVFLLKPNLRELREFSGKHLSSIDEQEQAARDLVKNKTCDVIVLSLGASGALLVTQDFSCKLSIPAVQVKSVVGAGDSTVAGIVLGLSRKMELKEAVMFGLAAGVSAVMSSANELCKKEDTEKMFVRIKEENNI